MTLRTALIAAALGLLTACQSTTVAAPGADVTRTSTRNPDVVVPASPAMPVAYSGSAEGGAALNAYRRQQGLPPLREHPALNRAAYDQASWMHQSGAQTHAGRSGSTVASRLRSAGCGWRPPRSRAQGRRPPPPPSTPRAGSRTPGRRGRRRRPGSARRR